MALAFSCDQRQFCPDAPLGRPTPQNLAHLRPTPSPAVPIPCPWVDRSLGRLRGKATHPSRASPLHSQTQQDRLKTQQDRPVRVWFRRCWEHNCVWALTSHNRLLLKVLGFSLRVTGSQKSVGFQEPQVLFERSEFPVLSRTVLTVL